VRYRPWFDDKAAPREQGGWIDPGAQRVLNSSRELNVIRGGLIFLLFQRHQLIKMPEKRRSKA